MGIPDAYYKKAINLLPLARQFMLKRTKEEVGLELSALRTEVIQTAWGNPNELELAEDIHALLSFSGSQKDLDEQQDGVSGTSRPTGSACPSEAGMCVSSSVARRRREASSRKGLLEDSAELRQALRASSKIDTVVCVNLGTQGAMVRNKLIFCHYRREIDVIRDDLERAGYACRDIRWASYLRTSGLRS